MRIGITTMPDAGYELFFRQNVCYVKLYKNYESVQECGEERKYADVVTHIIYFDDISTIEPDVSKNFEYYFSVEKEKELNQLKQQKLEELKNELFASALQNDFISIKTQIDQATTEAELEAVKL